jgi:NMD protein affecting ribosome stability and mRNA decay
MHDDDDDDDDDEELCYSLIINIIVSPTCLHTEGLDFFYPTEAYARKMVDFLVSVLPCRYQHSKKLISHDIHSNVYNYKFTYR